MLLFFTRCTASQCLCARIFPFPRFTSLCSVHIAFFNVVSRNHCTLVYTRIYKRKHEYKLYSVFYTIWNCMHLYTLALRKLSIYAMNQPIKPADEFNLFFPLLFHTHSSFSNETNENGYKLQSITFLLDHGLVAEGFCLKLNFNYRLLLSTVISFRTDIIK